MKSRQSVLLQTSSDSAPGTRASAHSWYTAVTRVFHTQGFGESTTAATAHQGALLKEQAQSGAAGIHPAEMPPHFDASKLSLFSHEKHLFGSAEISPSKTCQKVKASLYLFWCLIENRPLVERSWGSQKTSNRRADLWGFTAFREK